MELKWLEDFVALARTGSFSRAAQDRNVTQPAFSRRIRALEDWLGVTLVDRTVYPTTLTRYGEEFLPHAQDIVTNANGIRHDFRITAQSSRRQVKIVTLHTLAIHVVPPLVCQFLRTETSASIEIIPNVQGIEAYFDSLETGAAHIVIGYTRQIIHAAASDLVEKVVARDSFIPVVSRSFVNERGMPDFRHGRKIPLLAYSPFSFSHTILAPMLARIEDKVAVRGESALGESLKALVEQGLGVGWLPQYSIRRELEAGELVAVPDTDLQLAFDICAWRRDSLDHAVAKRLFESLPHAQ